MVNDFGGPLFGPDAVKVTSGNISVDVLAESAVATAALVPEVKPEVRKLFEGVAEGAVQSVRASPLSAALAAGTKIAVEFSVVTRYDDHAPARHVANRLRWKLARVIEIALLAPGRPVTDRVVGVQQDGEDPWGVFYTVTVSSDAPVPAEPPGCHHFVVEGHVHFADVRYGRFQRLSEGDISHWHTVHVYEALAEAVLDFWDAQRIPPDMRIPRTPHVPLPNMLVEFGVERSPPAWDEKSLEEISFAYADKIVALAERNFAKATAAPGAAEFERDEAWGCWVRVTCDRPEATPAPNTAAGA